MLFDSGTSIAPKVAIYPTWQEASSALRRLRVRGIEDYARKRSKNRRLPEKPDEVYKDFPGWPIFINRTNRPLYTTLARALEGAKKIGITSRSTYEKRYKKDPLLPGDLRIYPSFKGWDDLFEKAKYKTCAEARIAARKLRLDPALTPYYAYRKAFSQDKRLPHRPDKQYDDFTSYAEFLGLPEVKRGPKPAPPRGEPYPTWQEASAAARARKIDAEVPYLRLYRYDVRLPSDPAILYKDFPGWRKFLMDPADIPPPYPTWQEASRALMHLDIYSKEEYAAKHEEDLRLPPNPEVAYPDFPGWLLFLW
jgi:hypothetical protein